ncbi:CBS domain-containing protein [Cellulophaga baltica]|uniref:CBS domain-containing protein n=1 Tax=Cellulophaga TaxID=104264 RepID=UPI001C07AC9A|nr:MULTISPECIES: CBS domain-containing protein [Cellulophaga]MBU2995157.1 CBS domain-containing protein [Cellulophaga baltica]MDO6766552.1 CBS domain-containing protein [Cellulophaga sp. 1_MG-2023]
MNIQSHIIDTIPVFNMEDSMKNVVKFFKGTIYSHVAIVADDKFLGVISENDMAVLDSSGKIDDYRYNLEAVFVKKHTSWLDVLEAFARNEANLIPVLDEDGRVCGYYDLNDIVEIFIDTPFFTEPGGILVVAKGTKDYSFSEISQIVESNNTKLLGGFVSDSKNDVVQITLKIGTTNLNEIIQSFRRYNYTIMFGNNDDQFLEDLKQRSDYLNKFLNV